MPGPPPPRIVRRTPPQGRLATPEAPPARLSAPGPVEPYRTDQERLEARQSVLARAGATVHLLTEVSTDKGKRIVTTGCGLKGPVVGLKAPEDALSVTAWHHFITCPPCRERSEGGVRPWSPAAAEAKAKEEAKAAKASGKKPRRKR